MSENQVKLLQGNEACAEGALLAGVRFFAGYPITPSSEIAEMLSRQLPRVGGKFMQMEDEIASIAAVGGAALGGVKAMTATSGPGFSLMQENIGFLCLAEIPCLIVNVMRGGPSTGLPTQVSQMDVMQTRWGSHGDHFKIVLSASSVGEVLKMTITAVNLAERYRTPVVLLLDEVVAHMREKVSLPCPEDVETIERKRPTVPPKAYQPYETTSDDTPPMADFGSGYRYHVTGLIHDQWGFPTTRADEVESLLARLKHKIEGHRDTICMTERFHCEDAAILVVAYGCTARVARRAVTLAREDGIKAGLLKLYTLWPFPEEALRAACKKAKTIIVPELNMGQLVNEVQRVAAGRAKVVPINRYDGEMMEPSQILEALKEEESLNE